MIPSMRSLGPIIHIYANIHRLGIMVRLILIPLGGRVSMAVIMWMMDVVAMAMAMVIVVMTVLFMVHQVFECLLQAVSVNIVEMMRMMRTVVEVAQALTIELGTDGV